MNGRHPPTPGRRPGARVGSVRGVAPVAPLPPPRPSPTRHASPSQSPECAKVRVSQVRKSSCLLTGFSRHPRRQSAAELHRATRAHRPHGSERHHPVQPTRLGTPASAGTRGARAPRNCATPPALTAHTARNATIRYSPHGLERRLQPAPAAPERRGTAPRHPRSPPTRLGTPPSGTAHTARNAGLQARPPSRHAAREGRGRRP